MTPELLQELKAAEHSLQFINTAVFGGPVNTAVLKLLEPEFNIISDAIKAALRS